MLFGQPQFEASVHTRWLSKDPASAACLLRPWRCTDGPFRHVNVAGTEHNIVTWTKFWLYDVIMLYMLYVQAFSNMLSSVLLHSSQH